MTKPVIVTRDSKGSALTYTEHDANFTNLRDATISFVSGANTASLNLNDSLAFTAGSNITLTLNPTTKSLQIASSVDISNLVTLDGNQTITGNKTFTGITTLEEYVETVYSATFATPFTPNGTNGPIQKFTATSNFTLNLPTNMTAGKSIVLIIRQDATGSRIMTANSSYKFLGGNKTLGISPNGIDILSIFYDGTDYLASLAVGYS